MSYFLSSNTQDNSDILKPALWTGYSTEDRPTFTNGASGTIVFDNYSVKVGDYLFINWANNSADFCIVVSDGNNGLKLFVYALINDLPSA